MIIEGKQNNNYEDKHFFCDEISKEVENLVKRIHLNNVISYVKRLLRMNKEEKHSCFR